MNEFWCYQYIAILNNSAPLRVKWTYDFYWIKNHMDTHILNFLTTNFYLKFIFSQSHTLLFSCWRGMCVKNWI